MSRLAAALSNRGRIVPLGVVLVAGTLILPLMARVSRADLAGQSNDKRITLAVKVLLQSQHLGQHKLDDEISERWLKNYLKSLDPKKVFFTQADIDDYNKYRHSLDDFARTGDITFGYQVFKRFLERVDQRVKLVDEVLKEEPDYSVEEELDTNWDKAPYAKTDAEMRDKWRKLIKYDLLVLKADKSEKTAAHTPNSPDGVKPFGTAGGIAPEGKVPLAESPKQKNDKRTPQEKISKRYHSFAKRMHQTDNNLLLEMYLTALTTSYDPHTTYMSPDSLQNFEIQMRLNLEGIGAALQSVDGNTMVSKIIPGGAADKEGHLKPEDQVIAVGQGTSGELVDVVDMNLNDVVKLIRGPSGSIVRLKVIPDGQLEPKIYSITRAKIELTDSEARSEVIEAGKKPDGKPYKIGVIDLPSFYMDMNAAREGQEDFKSTTRDVARLLDDFKKKNVDLVVLDLRQNGGGSLTESINLTGLFIDTGPVVQVKGVDKRVQHYDDTERGMAWDGPLAVLTSKFSASASEIFAGAIQDYQRGLVIGDASTHGKGTVQSLLDLGRELTPLNPQQQMGALKITMQQFYRPNGDSTQNRGVLSDIQLPSLINELENVDEASLDYAMKFDHVDPVSYNSYRLTSPELVRHLRDQSAQRREKSSDFGKVEKNIARYNEQKKRKAISLNEKVFLAERAEVNADKEEEKEIEKMTNPNKPVFDKDNFYSAEVLAIAIDYLKALQVPQTVKR